MTVSAETRIAFVEGFQFLFHSEPATSPTRRVGSRWEIRHWSCQVEYDGEWSRFTLHEFNDGVFEPSALLGVFSDFAGAAATEATLRWLQRRMAEKDQRTRRQRDLFLGVLAVVAALGLATVSLR